MNERLYAQALARSMVCTKGVAVAYDFLTYQNNGRIFVRPRGQRHGFYRGYSHAHSRLIRKATLDEDRNRRG